MSNKKGIEARGSDLYLNDTMVGGNGGGGEESVDYATVYGIVGTDHPGQCATIREKFDSGNGKALRFVHISDSHGGNVGDYMGAAPEFTDKCEADFLVHTGDIVTDSYNDDFSTHSLAKLLSVDKPTFITLGNHDVFKSSTLQQRFEKYIYPLNAHNGLATNTKTYYSVDYADSGVKCIFLDYLDAADDSSAATAMPSQLVSGAMSDAQVNWFIAQLADAAANDLHVAVFLHQAPSNISYPQPNWYERQTEPASNIAFLREIVYAWQNKGRTSSLNGAYNVTYNGNTYSGTFAKRGHFVGWFCGHTHYDSCGRLDGFPDQFCVCITRPSFGTSANDGIVRPIGWYEYLFNYVKIDSDKRCVSIIRVGSDLLSEGGSRGMFTYEYV